MASGVGRAGGIGILPVLVAVAQSGSPHGRDARATPILIPPATTAFRLLKDALMDSGTERYDPSVTMTLSMSRISAILAIVPAWWPMPRAK